MTPSSLHLHVRRCLAPCHKYATEFSAAIVLAVAFGACNGAAPPQDGGSVPDAPHVRDSLPDRVSTPPVVSTDATGHCAMAAPADTARTVQVVFTCGERPASVWRTLPQTRVDVLTFALEALLAGPTDEERARGMTSFFSSRTAGMLNRVELRDGTAFIDFADFSGIIPNASTSAGSAQLLHQLTGTIFQFDGVREAELSFDGSCAAFWEWLQRGCDRLQRSAR